MIEVTFIEVGLFCWAVLATGYACKYKQTLDGANNFIRVILSDKKTRDEVVADFEEFVESQ
jgi:hypothetical protein